MMEKALAPLILVQKAGTIGGKTRLQKLMCLLEATLAERRIRLGYHFQLYHYGPFSFDLANAIEELVEQGFLIEQPIAMPNGHIQYSYWLTDDGVKLAHELITKVPEFIALSNVISGIVEHFGGLSTEMLIASAYSVYPVISSDSEFIKTGL
jgi:uncharacterized protein YwgA